MATVKFRVRLSLRVPVERVWQSLVDWQGHAKWIPSTRVSVDSGDGGVGTEFTATTSLGPFALPDRMRVVALDVEQRTAAVEKLGPVLTGRAGFSLRPVAGGASLSWEEEVEAKALPAALAPVAGWLGALLFAAAIMRLEWQLRNEAGR